MRSEKVCVCAHMHAHDGKKLPKWTRKILTFSLPQEQKVSIFLLGGACWGGVYPSFLGDAVSGLNSLNPKGKAHLLLPP